MDNFWNDRYSKSEYVYGISPNEFFKENIGSLLPGKLLLPAEGEGRNAVYASKLGWDVTAFDSSINAKKKAEALAKIENVNIKYIISDFNSFSPETNSFDCIALIFAHLPKPDRRLIHNKLFTYLKHGGKLLLEGFSKEQINKDTGGPKNLDMLFSKNELMEDFEAARKMEILETTTILREGVYHNGEAFVIRMVAEK